MSLEDILLEVDIRSVICVTQVVLLKTDGVSTQIVSQEH